MELRVVRITDRFDDACRFYGEILGWPVTRQWDDSGRGRIFGYGDVGRIELMEGAANPISGVFLSVECDGVDALAGRLAAAGVALTQPVADQPWGHRNVGVVDPTGLTVMFFESIA
jgi:predicted enzyme related to lactoylglutathione lyase